MADFRFEAYIDALIAKRQIWGAGTELLSWDNYYNNIPEMTCFVEMLIHSRMKNKFNELKLEFLKAPNPLRYISLFKCAKFNIIE